MTPFLKILLTASITLFLASLTDFGSAIAGGFLKPLSVILFVVFFIGQLLHKEVVKYDEEQRMRMALVKASSTSPRVTKRFDPVGEKRPNASVLVAAH